MSLIYPCLTTWPSEKVWHNQLSDINKYGLRNIAVFLTKPEVSERKKIYYAIRKSKIRHIPHLHIRHDMDDWELSFFYKHYHTRQFNIHAEFLPKFKNCIYKKLLLVETTHTYSLNLADLPFTIDLAHLYSKRKIILKINLKQNVDKIIARGNKPKANHLNGIKKNGIDTHYIKSISEFDYLKKMPKKYLTKEVCLEIGNPIEEQLYFMKYLAKIL